MLMENVGDGSTLPVITDFRPCLPCVKTLPVVAEAAHKLLQT
jgi:hypothetical protein